MTASNTRAATPATKHASRIVPAANPDIAAASKLEDGLLMVVEADGQRVGLFVDDLLGQQQVVIKSLETNFRQVQGISGATILGDGTVALIVDVPGLIQRHFNNCNHRKVALTTVA